MVKSRSGSSDVMSSTYVPMIGCFVAGFITNRLLNHQNVVTGELEEGNKTDDMRVVMVIIIVVGVICFGVGAWKLSGGTNLPRVFKSLSAIGLLCVIIPLGNFWVAGW